MANRTRRLQRRQLPVKLSMNATTSAEQQQQQQRRGHCIIFSTLGFFIVNLLIFVVATAKSNSAASPTPVPAVLQPMTTATQHRRFEVPEQVPDSVISLLDAILVLGGGVPRSVVEPPIFVQRRLDDAVAIVKRKRQLANNNDDWLPILCLSAGTAHLPQLLSSDGLPIWEATASAGYLLEQHAETIHPGQVFVETSSYDTIGNAFYARTSFTDVTGWRRLLIITNEFHMDRSQAIFDWIFGIPSVSGTNAAYQLHYLAPPNVGMTPAAVEARREREGTSLAHVQTILSKKYQTLHQVWEFLTREHGLYTAEKLVDRGKQQLQFADAMGNEALKESYGGAKVVEQNTTPSPPTESIGDDKVSSL